MKTIEVVAPLNLMASAVQDRLIERADMSWSDFMEGETIYIDEEAVLGSALEYVLDDLPEGEAERVVESLLDHPLIVNAFVAMREVIQERAEEAREWQQAQQSPESMLRYHGLSMSEFI